MNDELFPAEAVTMDSPRRAWRLRHGVRLHHSPGDEFPWCAWLPSNDDAAIGGDPIPLDSDKCGYGKTDEEALLDLAATIDLPTWLTPIPA